MTPYTLAGCGPEYFASLNPKHNSRCYSSYYWLSRITSAVAISHAERQLAYITAQGL